MKINSIKTYTYHAYHAVVMDEKGLLHTGNRITVLSEKPLKVTAHKLEDKLVDGGYYDKNGDDPMAVTLLRNSHLDYMLTFEHPDEKGKVFLVDDTVAGGRADVFDSPLRVMSQHDEWFLYEDYAPVPVIATLTRQKDLVGEEVDAKDLLEASMKRVERIAEADAKFGVKTAAAKAAERIKREGPELLKMAASLPDELRQAAEAMFAKVAAEVVGGDGVQRQTLDGDKARFTPAKATDFTRVALLDDNGNMSQRMQLLRVAHLDDPTWHQPDEDMKAQGFIGFWEFPRAVLGSAGERTADHIEVIYSGFDNLKVAVKTVDAIAPAGMMPIPVEVYRALANAEPTETMSAKEASAYSRDHLAKPIDEFVGGASN